MRSLFGTANPGSDLRRVESMTKLRAHLFKREHPPPERAHGCAPQNPQPCRHAMSNFNGGQNDDEYIYAHGCRPGNGRHKCRNQKFL